MILRVNLKKLKAYYEDLPEELRLIGGRGITAKIMNREVPPTADPLGADNKLIIAGGPLAGTLAPQLGRISIGGKSPLTLGIKESTAGGPAAQKLDKLGLRCIIVEDIPEAGKWHILTITKNGAELLPADEYQGMKNYQLVNSLFNRYMKNLQ
jgi:aldehyde:ferredoxin oxidoreductase